MKSVYFVYLQDHKHKRTIAQSNNCAVEEKAAATKRCTCQRHGLAVPRAGDRSYVTGSIHGWSRSHLTYVTGGW